MTVARGVFLQLSTACEAWQMTEDEYIDRAVGVGDIGTCWKYARDIPTAMAIARGEHRLAVARAKATLWRRWRKEMGLVSPSDLQQAQAWFEELYQAGQGGKACPLHCGSPLSYTERQVYEAGQYVYRQKGGKR